MLYSSILPVYGMDEVCPHNTLAPMPYLRVLSAAFVSSPAPPTISLSNIDHPFLDFLNVRVIASSIASRPRADRRRSFGQAWIYRNPDALPRFFLPKGVKLIAEEEIESYIAKLEDPWRVAVFDPLAKAWVGESGNVKATILWPGRIDLEVPGPGDRLLATSLLRPEGWRTAGLEKIAINGASWECPSRPAPPTSRRAAFPATWFHRRTLAGSARLCGHDGSSVKVGETRALQRGDPFGSLGVDFAGLGRDNSNRNHAYPRRSNRRRKTTSAERNYLAAKTEPPNKSPVGLWLATTSRDL